MVKYGNRFVVCKKKDGCMQTGKAGENTAEAYLRNMGYRIIDRNFRCKKGEIDLIVKKHNIMVFVEVKTRNSFKFGHPSESITESKRKHIRSTAYWYINSQNFNGPELDYRFDVMEILRLDNRQYVNHIENAFQ